MNYKVDLDYENYLFDPTYKEDLPKFTRMIAEFEYIFFIINKEPAVLLNYKNYSPSYLNKLKKLGFLIPHFSSDKSSVEYFWGRRKNKVLEQILNSKLTSAKFSKENNLGFENGAIVKNLEEVQEYIAQSKYENFILKSPFGFSGIGHVFFDKNFIPLVKFDHEFLLEPIYERILDLGFTFQLENGKVVKEFFVINHNNQKGSFKGGIGHSDQEKLKEWVFTNYHVDLNSYLDDYKKIVNYYIELGADGNLQIDSFAYKQNEEVKLYPLVEVNYRKTMGLVINSLAEKFPNQFVDWQITHTSEFENKPEWVKLSPDGNKFNSYFKLSNDYIVLK